MGVMVLEKYTLAFACALVMACAPKPAAPTTPPAEVAQNADAVTNVEEAIPDSDGDGILDNVDACVFDAETKNDFQDEDGCPDERPPCCAVPKKYTLYGVDFVAGSSELSDEAIEKLDKNVVVLKQFPTLKIRLTGDMTAQKKKAEALARARVAAVKAHMVKGGVAAENLEEDVAVIKDADADSQGAPHRVILTVLPVDGKPSAPASETAPAP